jgi:hypothetical protein
MMSQAQIRTIAGMDIASGGDPCLEDIEVTMRDGCVCRLDQMRLAAT